MVATTRARSKTQGPGQPDAQIPAISAHEGPSRTSKVAKPRAKKISKKAPTAQNHLKNAKATILNATKPIIPTKNIDSTSSQLSLRERCLAGGLNGPKVYDDLGFELSYEACAGIS
jgi:hypothetical protein